MNYQAARETCTILHREFGCKVDDAIAEKQQANRAETPRR
jgi:hypothetical protein